MRSDRIDGFLFERGPNTTRIPAERARRCCAARGDEAALVQASPESRARFLLRREGLVRCRSVRSASRATPLLSRAGKWRLLREPFVARGDGASESVAAFVERRLGREAVDALVGPFLVGVYAGDEAQLGAEAVFPTLVCGRARERLDRARRCCAARCGAASEGSPGTWSARGGLGGLAAGLARPLGARAAARRARAGARARSRRAGASSSRAVRSARAPWCSPRTRMAPLRCSRRSTPRPRRFLRALPFAPIVSVALALDGERHRRARPRASASWCRAICGLDLARRAVHEPAVRGPRAGRQRARDGDDRRAALARRRRCARRRAARARARRARSRARPAREAARARAHALAARRAAARAGPPGRRARDPRAPRRACLRSRSPAAAGTASRSASALASGARAASGLQSL